MMSAKYVCVLVISAGVISFTGIMVSWIMGFQRSEIRIKSSVNSFTINSNAAQAKMATLAGPLDVTEGVTYTPKAQIITSIPGTASVNMMSGSSVVSRASSVATAEPSLQTTAETAPASAAGAVRSTAGETIVSSETIEQVKIHTLTGTKQAEKQETVETTPGETVTTCTQTEDSTNVEALTDTAQKTPELERISDITQTHKNETDVTIFKKPAEISIIPEQELGTATANIRSANPITQLVTDGATHFITSKLRTLKIIPENKATTKTRPDITFRTAAVMTETKVDLTEGKPAPSTVIKSLKTAGTEPSKVETSEENTATPQKSSQAIKTTNGPTINLLTMIQTATGKQANTGGNQLSTAGTGITTKSNVLKTIKSTKNGLNTISLKRQTADKLTTRSHKTVSPCRGKCKTKSTTKNTTGRQGKVQTPLSSDKTFYSAITMGSILVICGLLALVVFMKDLMGPK